MSADTVITRDGLIAEKAHKTYAAMAEKYGINQWYLWNIIVKPNYVPPAWVQDIFGWQRFAIVPVCPRCGTVHVKVCGRSNKIVDLSKVPVEERKYLLSDAMKGLMTR